MRAYCADEFEKVETETPAAIPDWLEVTGIQPTSSDEQPAPEEKPESGEESELPTSEESLDADLDFEDADAAMAWLEGLTAKQGVSEDELLSNPERRHSETPGYCQAAVEADGQTVLSETVGY